MQRLLTAKNIYQSSLSGIQLSHGSLGVSAVHHIKCSFCQKVLFGRPNIENLYHIRHQSTKTLSALQKAAKKRVKYKNYKKFGEVLQVNDSSMKEAKVSISKFNSTHFSKLASSSVTLGELHQLTQREKQSRVTEVDPELLKNFREKVLNKTVRPIDEIKTVDDNCALVFTNTKITSIEDKLKTKEYVDAVRDSYYNFRKATMFDQRLLDLHSAINEGLNQEFDLHPETVESNDFYAPQPKKGPHAVFKELFFDNQLDSYDQELLANYSNLHARDLTHPELEEFDDPLLSHDLPEAKEDLEQYIIPADTAAKTLKVNKAKNQIKARKKAAREKRRAQQEETMKDNSKELEMRAKQAALHRLLSAHLNLLCSLNMTKEGNQVLQYYRTRSKKVTGQPKVMDVKIFNTMLHGYAATGDYSHASKLLNQMEEDNVQANAQTYAAIFECVERSNVIKYKLQILQNHFEKMSNLGITLNDLLDKTKFLYDQRDTVLSAVRRLDPSFVPQYTPPPLDYNCPLLENLKLDRPENRMGLLETPVKGIMTVEEMKERVKKQIEIEIRGEIEVANINFQDDSSANIKFYRQKLQETETEWRDVIKEAFLRNLGTLKSQSNVSHSAITLYPYLKILNVDQFVDLIMGELNKLVDGSETYSPTLKLLQRDLGSQVFYKYQIEQYRRNGVLTKIEKILDKYCEWYVNREPVDGKTPYNGRQTWQLLAHNCKEGADLDVQEAEWPMEIRQNIGKFLYNIIINDIKIDVNMFKNKSKTKLLPAVYKLHRPWGRVSRLELKPHPALCRLWAAAQRPGLRLRAALAPLLCTAAPWPAPRASPYLLTATPLLRLPFNMTQQWERLDQAPAESLYPVLDSLNQLGEVPWVVNTPVLDIQLQIFRSGGNKKLDIPEPPSSLDISQFEAGESKASAFRRRVAVNRARAEMYSLWCDALYKLSLANHYRNEIFWLPHNMDFRGRVYACPPHLSQLGADSARALLQFANKKPLGPNGLKWLKLHAINLTGTMKKNTVEERLAYAEEILPEIIESADQPLSGRGWWMQSEEPWQTLACCREIAAALRHPNHEEYMSGFPVHQDGSCNGLQHYAALGADSAGAAAVNLAPAARPSDVYTAVSSAVETMRARDAAAGVKAAVVLEGFVRRKVIKQTVMTTVYGVTRFGARLQIAKQLKDIEEFPKNQVWSCSQYLTTRTFDSLREMFTSTKLIQDWLTECAKAISGVCGRAVEWRTPLGLPVLQPYYGKTQAASHTPDLRPCTMKQRNAFPPNFIHSLDSSHMMLTSLRCQARGLGFVSVHDCFWTHPNTVDVMNKICREEFVALHSQPILNDLSEFLSKQYSYDANEISENPRGAASKRRVNKLLRQVPKKGDFKLDNVLDSVYFFS